MHPIFDERRYLIPFRATLLPQIFTDTLVVGAGVAGLRAALEAAEFGDVIVAGKGEIKHSSTYWAQGGIAAVLDGCDSIDAHMQDTMTAGAGLCDEPVVRLVVEEGPASIEELEKLGMPLDMAGDGYALGREGGHSKHRIVHTNGDATGKALSQTLDAATRQHERIRRFDRCFVLDIITLDTESGAQQCLGAITHHPRYGLQVIWAKSTILAAGGCGMVFRESTNPNVATGDALAMAYRAGAELQDLAFMQFHPTTLYIAGASRALITEAVRGEGATLIDRDGQRFMPDYDERAELAPRDVVSRCILKHLAKTGTTHVFLDARHLTGFAERFPGIHQLLGKFELDAATQPIPVHPSAHYYIGGVRTDIDGRSSIPGLFACGEASCTGLHGANRLASNSLLEGLVFGRRAGAAAGQRVASHTNGSGPVKVISDIRPSDRSELDLADVRSSLRSVMWRHVGIEREGDRLAEVAEMFDFWSRYTLDKIFDDRAGWEVQNLLYTGALITRAARWRQESRGTHHRTDCPKPSDAYRLHDVWQRGQPEPERVALAMS